METHFYLTHAEEKLAGLLWDNAPLGSGELTVLAQSRFGWKRTTTFSVLKRLIEKGIAQNKAARVSVVLSREAFASAKSRGFVAETFGGSLPRFITAFIGNGKLTPAQAAEIRKLVDETERRQ